MKTYTFNLKNPNGTIDTVSVNANNLREALQICRRDYRDPYTEQAPLNTELASKL